MSTAKLRLLPGGAGDFRQETKVGVTEGATVGVRVTVGISSGVALAGNHKTICICAASAVTVTTVSIPPGAAIGKVAPDRRGQPP